MSEDNKFFKVAQDKNERYIVVELSNENDKTGKMVSNESWANNWEGKQKALKRLETLAIEVTDVQKYSQK